MTSLRSKSELSIPTIKAKTPQAMIWQIVANTISGKVIGTISPYPTVVIVVKAKKAEEKYSSRGLYFQRYYTSVTQVFL